MQQSTTLNFTSQPVACGQSQPGPEVTASGGDVVAVQADVDALTLRVTALEGLFTSLGSFVDDAAAATGGVPVHGLYRNGSAVMVRVA
jgi:hypothetical protein